MDDRVNYIKDVSIKCRNWLIADTTGSTMKLKVIELQAPSVLAYEDTLRGLNTQGKELYVFILEKKHR